MLVNFEAAIHPPVFDAGSSFTLNFGATEYETIVAFPHIQRLLEVHAPKGKLRIVALDTSAIFEQLEQLDFIFGSVDVRSDKIETLEVLQDEGAVFYDRKMRVTLYR